jgi:hypothetical protein
MLKLKGTLMLANADEVAAIQALRLKSSEKNKMTRDHNGFRKLLIVLTKAGKVRCILEMGALSGQSCCRPFVPSDLVKCLLP